MNVVLKPFFVTLVVAGWVALYPAPLLAGEPSVRALENAIENGRFADYLVDLDAWLNKKVPAAPDEDTLDALLKNEDFRLALNQRQLIAKTGADTLSAFAAEDPGNREFLAWVMKSAAIMDLYLEGCVPIGLAAREENTYRLGARALTIWKKIFVADPDSRDGLLLKLAIATGIAPPGSVNIGAGGAATPSDPVVRYNYYKAAYLNKELLPSFDHLCVWEYSRIVSSGASNEDLTWARRMVNTFRPDLLINERVVRSTSLVWRRAAPAQFYPAGYVNFKNVLAGGGKCGPKSSWGQMICQAFGIPAIGVGQPAHACVAYKSAYPENDPQPGNAWKVDYGRGWHVSKLMGLSGPDFVAGVGARTDAEKFSRVEHLRWLSAALTPAERARYVKEHARTIQETPSAAAAAKRATEKVEALPVTGSDVPIRAADGMIHVEAADFARTGGKVSWGGQKPYVEVHDSVDGGKQVYFEQQMKEQWADYILDVPESGIYSIVMKAACINVDQDLEVCLGTNVIATVPIPLSYGLWQETSPVPLKLEKGVQTLRLQTPTREHRRGIALRWFRVIASES